MKRDPPESSSDDNADNGSQVKRPRHVIRRNTKSSNAPYYDSRTTKRNPYNRPRARYQIQEHRAAVDKPQRIWYLRKGKLYERKQFFGEKERANIGTVFHAANDSLFASTLLFPDGSDLMLRRKALATKRRERLKEKRKERQKMGQIDDEDQHDTSTSISDDNNSDEELVNLDALNNQMIKNGTDDFDKTRNSTLSVERQSGGLDIVSDPDKTEEHDEEKDSVNIIGKENEEVDDEEAPEGYKSEEEGEEEDLPITESEVMDSLDPNTWTFNQTEYSDRYQRALVDYGTHDDTLLRQYTSADDYLRPRLHALNYKSGVPIVDNHPDLPHTDSSELLSALQVYAMEMYNVLGYNRKYAFQQLDETALLALGILIEEYISEMLGPKGHESYMEFEQPDKKSREARRQTPVPKPGRNEPAYFDNEYEDENEGIVEEEELTEPESDPDDIPGLGSYIDIRGFRDQSPVS